MAADDEPEFDYLDDPDYNDYLDDQIDEVGADRYLYMAVAAMVLVLVTFMGTKYLTNPKVIYKEKVVEVEVAAVATSTSVPPSTTEAPPPETTTTVAPTTTTTLGPLPCVQGAPVPPIGCILSPTPTTLPPGVIPGQAPPLPNPVPPPNPPPATVPPAPSTSRPPDQPMTATVTGCDRSDRGVNITVSITNGSNRIRRAEVTTEAMSGGAPVASRTQTIPVPAGGTTYTNDLTVTGYRVTGCTASVD